MCNCWQLPQPVRTGIEARLGAPVRLAVTQTGGYSHGAAVRLLLNDGRRAFAKVINCDDQLCGMYQTEARTAARLPPTVPTPAVQFTAELAGWFVMVFDDVAGCHPRLDKPAELDAVLTAVEQLTNVLTPSPIRDVPAMTDSYGPELNCWRHFAEHGPPVDLDSWSLRNLDRLAELESTWPEATDGTTLLHTDLRPDNMLLRPDGTVVVIDWAWPCVGAAWLDLVSLAPSITARRDRPRSDPCYPSGDPHNRLRRRRCLSLCTGRLLGAQQPGAPASTFAETAPSPSMFGASVGRMAASTTCMAVAATRLYR